MKTLLWIDDQKSREKAAGQVSTYLGFDLKFIHVTSGMDMDEILGKIYETDSADLIFIDHYLAVGDLEGSSLVALVAAQWPGIAVIGITGARKRDSISLSKEIYYTYLVEQTSGSGLRNRLPKIRAIIDGFSVISERGFSLTNCGELLDCPAIDRDLLIQVIPEHLLSLDGSGVQILFHWIQSSFLSKPGLLYDGEWAAASLGLTKTGFSQIESFFSEAQYKGIFSCETEPRWWKRQLWALGFKLVSDEIVSPSKIGEKLTGIEPRHLAKCPHCNELYTEVLAYSDRTKTDRQAVHRRCCQELPTHREFFSEPDYIVLGA